MPLKGFTCPPTVPTAGNRNEIAHCLGSCPHPCTSPPLLNAIYRADQANHHVGNYISASMLSGSLCPRQTVFERRHDFYEQPVRRYWSFRGTHAHSIIEGGAETLAEFGWLQELRMAVPLEYPNEPAPIFDEGEFTGKFDNTKPLIITLGGTTDAYNPTKAPYPLWDFKTTADVKAEMLIKGTKGGTYSPNLDDRWVVQTNVYRWLVANTPIPAAVKKRLKLKGKFYPAPEWLGIQAIAMMSMPRTGMAYELKYKKYEIDDVPIIPLDEIEQLIRTEALKWFRWLVLGDTPPVVSAEMSWLCKSCAFNGDLIPGERCRPSQERDEIELAA